MNYVIYNVYSWICALVGGYYSIGWLNIPADYETFHHDGVYAGGNGDIFTVIGWHSEDPAVQPIIPSLCNAITSNPIVLICVIMILVFVGVRILRRLCDA